MYYTVWDGGDGGRGVEVAETGGVERRWVVGRYLFVRAFSTITWTPWAPFCVRWISRIVLTLSGDLLITLLGALPGICNLLAITAKEVYGEIGKGGRNATETSGAFVTALLHAAEVVEELLHSGEVDLGTAGMLRIPDYVGE